MALNTENERSCNNCRVHCLYNAAAVSLTHSWNINCELQAKANNPTLKLSQVTSLWCKKPTFPNRNTGTSPSSSTPSTTKRASYCNGGVVPHRNPQVHIFKNLKKRGTARRDSPFTINPSAPPQTAPRTWWVCLGRTNLMRGEQGAETTAEQQHECGRCSSPKESGHGRSERKK